MNAAHAHLVLNHIPIFGTLFGLLLLLYALVSGNDEIKKASFGAFVITSLITIPAFSADRSATLKFAQVSLNER
jgi:hypothetical protein